MENRPHVPVGGVIIYATRVLTAALDAQTVRDPQTTYAFAHQVLRETAHLDPQVASIIIPIVFVLMNIATAASVLPRIRGSRRRPPENPIL